MDCDASRRLDSSAPSAGRQRDWLGFLRPPVGERIEFGSPAVRFDSPPEAIGRLQNQPLYFNTAIGDWNKAAKITIAPPDISDSPDKPPLLGGWRSLLVRRLLRAPRRPPAQP
jgi:hypothetical protein